MNNVEMNRMRQPRVQGTSSLVSVLMSLALVACGGGGGGSDGSMGTAPTGGSTATPSGSTSTPAGTGSGGSSTPTTPSNNSSTPNDLVYADSVPASANLFPLGASRTLVSNLNVERSAWRLASDENNAYAVWVEYDRRTAGGVTSKMLLKTAALNSASWSPATLPTADLFNDRQVAIAANGQGGVTVAWVEYVDNNGSRAWRIKSAETSPGATTTTEVAFVPNADSNYLANLVVWKSAGQVTRVFWTQQTQPAGFELWQAVREGAGWKAGLLRRIEKGSMDNVVAWGKGQSGLAWIERGDTGAALLTAMSDSLASSQPEVVTSASTLLDVKAATADSSVAIAWRGSNCASLGTAGPVQTCMTVRDGAGPWKAIRALGTLTSLEPDSLSIAARPAGQFAVAWSGEVGAKKQVAIASCSTSACSPSSTVATPDMGNYARTSVTATKSGFAMAWADVDPYATYLGAVSFLRLNAEGAAVGTPVVVRGVFYGSGQSPSVREVEVAGVGDNVLLGWRIERFNTDATSDLNGMWVAQ